MWNNISNSKSAQPNKAETPTDATTTDGTTTDGTKDVPTDNKTTDETTDETNQGNSFVNFAFQTTGAGIVNRLIKDPDSASFYTLLMYDFARIVICTTVFLMMFATFGTLYTYFYALFYTGAVPTSTEMISCLSDSNFDQPYDYPLFTFTVEKTENDITTFGTKTSVDPRGINKVFSGIDPYTGNRPIFFFSTLSMGMMYYAYFATSVVRGSGFPFILILAFFSAISLGFVLSVTHSISTIISFISWYYNLTFIYYVPQNGNLYSSPEHWYMKIIWIIVMMSALWVGVIYCISLGPIFNTCYLLLQMAFSGGITTEEPNGKKTNLSVVNSFFLFMKYAFNPYKNILVYIIFGVVLYISVTVTSSSTMFIGLIIGILYAIFGAKITAPMDYNTLAKKFTNFGDQHTDDTIERDKSIATFNCDLTEKVTTR